MANDDLDYYRSRVAVERERARKAANPEAVSAHRQLADAYMHRIGDDAGREQRHV